MIHLHRASRYLTWHLASFECPCQVCFSLPSAKSLVRAISLLYVPAKAEPIVVEEGNESWRREVIMATSWYETIIPWIEHDHDTTTAWPPVETPGALMTTTDSARPMTQPSRLRHEIPPRRSGQSPPGQSGNRQECQTMMDGIGMPGSDWLQRHAGRLPYHILGNWVCLSPPLSRKNDMIA